MIDPKLLCFPLCLSLAFFALMASFSGWASVTMTVTRIIYRSDMHSVDVNLTNNGDMPYRVKIWFDAANINNEQESKGNVPFVATPASFRMEAHSGQVVRVYHTASRRLPASYRLPEDRESVFYFNIQQIPPSKAGGTVTEMPLMSGHQVKLFYRPARLGNLPANVISTIKASPAKERNRTGVTITNTLPFYLNLGRIQLNGVGSSPQVVAGMVAPFSSRTFWFTRTTKTENNTVSLTVINDQGAGISGDITL
ncbi:TPA: fimbria/pilus periplasmic chaperone [Klebsiella variicola subsp. variicola]